MEMHGVNGLRLHQQFKDDGSAHKVEQKYDCKKKQGQSMEKRKWEIHCDVVWCNYGHRRHREDGHF